MSRRRLLLPTAAVAAAAACLAAIGAAPAHAKGGEVGGSGTTYYLNDAWSGQANHTVTYGQRGDRAYAGDWNGDGVDNLAVRERNRYWLTDVGGEPADWSFTYGRDDDVTLMGDWDGDGIDTPAVRRGSTYYIANTVASGPADVVLAYGRPGDQVLVGDWNADGKDTLAVRRGNRFFFADQLKGGQASRVVAYGRAGDRVYVGDWNADGKDTPAVRRGATYYVTDRFAPGPADRVLTYGRAGDRTLVGDWNGDGKDTLGVRRDDTPTLSPAAAWARTTFGTFEPTSLNGEASQVIEIPAGARAGILTGMSFRSGSFTVEVLADGVVVDTPVDYPEDPGYATFTSTPYGVSPASRGTHLRVTAPGEWTLKLQPMETAPLLPQSGAWDGVYLYGGPAADVKVSHNGGGAFLVRQWSGKAGTAPRVIADASGAYSKGGALAAGPSVVSVVSTGRWSITPR